MAYQDQFYTTGTVTVTSGSPTVTGAGTGWQTALIQGGVLYVRGGAYPILTVDGETKITLAVPYTGTNGSGVLYAVDRQRSAATSAVAMNDRLAQIIASIETAQPASEVLAGLAALQPANNQLIYATGPKTFNLSPLTSFARTLLDDNDAAAMRSTLDLTDTSIQSRILNSYGNYAPAGGVNVNNLNAGDAGLYNTANTGTPTIPGVSWWWIETQRLYSTNAVRQIATAYSTSGAPLPYVLVRMRSADGTWVDWSGHSSQWFSNANGFCYRDTSGFQMCYLNASAGSDGDFTWTYPAAFVGASPNAWASPVGSTTNGVASHVVTRNLTSATFRLRYSSTNAAVATALYVQAVGRWF